MNVQRWVSAARDTTLWLVGCGGIIHQQVTGKELPFLLLVYTAILAIPGAANLGAILTRGGGTASPSESPQPPSPVDSQ